VVVGEVGLGGEIRTVVQAEQRVAEASKLGFRAIVLPASNMKSFTGGRPIELTPVASLTEAMNAII
jgi:DNA repair protein RadA/Sms